jgi:hypothetical protein
MSAGREWFASVSLATLFLVVATTVCWCDVGDDESEDDFTPRRQAHWNYGGGVSFTDASRVLYEFRGEIVSEELSWTGFHFFFGGMAPIANLSRDLTLAFDINLALGFGFPTRSTPQSEYLFTGQIPAHAVIQWGGLRRRSQPWGAAFGVGATPTFTSSDLVGGVFIAPSVYVDLIYAPKWYAALRLHTNPITVDYNNGRTLRMVNVSLIFGSAKPLRSYF